MVSFLLHTIYIHYSHDRISQVAAKLLSTASHLALQVSLKKKERSSLCEAQTHNLSHYSTMLYHREMSRMTGGLEAQTREFAQTS